MMNPYSDNPNDSHPEPLHDIDEFSGGDKSMQIITASSFAEPKSRYWWLNRRYRKAWYGAAGIVLLIIIISVSVSASKKKRQSQDLGMLLAPDDMENILRDAVGDSYGKEFDVIGSYPYKAMEWVKQNPLYSDDRTTHRMSIGDRLLQRFALACIYYSTYQVNNQWMVDNRDTAKTPDNLFPWRNSKGWLVYENECDWNGVDCDDRGYVTHLDLGTNDLSGSFPKEAAFLAKSLEMLNIENSYCHNSGDKGMSFLGELTNLKYLYMTNTLMEYNGLPTYFGNLHKLQELDVSYAMFDGKPLDGALFEQLQSLRYFEISGNLIYGTVPSSTTDLQKLKYFHPDNVGLSGSLDFLKNMPSLVETWLDRNPGFSGPLPIDLPPTLESLSLTMSNFTGSIPSEWAKLDRMKHLWLYDNQLTGTVPSEFAKLTRLQTFRIEANDIIGSIPDSICEMQFLSAMSADCNAEGGDRVACYCCTCCGPTCVTFRTVPPLVHI